ncbi:MAG: iron ABC transporter permease, partial [Brevibacterium sp.]|nr:iron ABC transporter permease [Brevibacterium sp.]
MSSETSNQAGTDTTHRAATPDQMHRAPAAAQPADGTDQPDGTAQPSGRKSAQASGSKSERRHDVRRLPLLSCVLIGLVVLALLMTVSASVGPLRIPLGEVTRIVGAQLGLVDGSELGQRDVSVVWQLRVPRVLMGVQVGAALAVS